MTGTEEKLRQAINYYEIIEDAFVLKNDDIYIFTDVLSIHEDVVQILFQIHHELLDDPIVETTVAAGSTLEEAIYCACQKFNDNVLSLYTNAIHQNNGIGYIEGYTQERHLFDVYPSKVSGIGKKEGIDQGFWQDIKEEVRLRLGNKKIYWVKVFASRDNDKAEAEVWINGFEATEISEKILSLAMDWEIIGSMHTEKQYFTFVQREETYEKSCFTKEQIQTFAKKAMQEYEVCKDKQEHIKILNQLIKVCGDDSLAYEIFGFIPEIYCKYAYPNIEFGEKLLVVQKEEKTIEIYQSQVQSFLYIDEIIKKHFENDSITEEALKNVLSFSANAKAIYKTQQQGCCIDHLFVPAMGYFVNEYYQIR